MSKIYETATVMAVHRERYELLVENQKMQICAKIHLYI